MTTVDLSTTGAVVGILVGLITILTAAFWILRWIIQSVVNDGLHENNSATRQVLEQVKNSHTTNLRQDIDQVMQFATSARLAADDAKGLAATASASIRRIEGKVDSNGGVLNDHIAFSERIIAEGAGSAEVLNGRTEVLEKAISDLSAAIKSVADSTPLQHEEPPQEEETP